MFFCKVPFKLQEGVVRIISLSQCQSYFDMKTITPRMLCAGYEAGTVDSCMVTSAPAAGLVHVQTHFVLIQLVSE